MHKDLSFAFALSISICLSSAIYAQQMSGGSIFRAACENNLAMTKYDCIVEHWSSVVRQVVDKNGSLQDKDKNGPPVSFEQVERLRIIVDRDLERFVFATERKLLPDGQKGKFSKLDYSLEMFQNGTATKIIKFPKGYSKTSSKQTFTRSFGQVPNIPMISLAGFPFYLHNQDLSKIVADSCEKYQKSSARYLPDGTVVVTSEGTVTEDGAEKREYSKKYTFTTRSPTPCKYISNTTIGKWKIEEKYAVEFEEVDGLFRPASVTYDGAEPRPGPTLDKVFLDETVGTLEIKWLQFGGTEIKFPDEAKLLEDWPNVPSFFGDDLQDADSGTKP